MSLMISHGRDFDILSRSRRPHVYFAILPSTIASLSLHLIAKESGRRTSAKLFSVCPKQSACFAASGANYLFTSPTYSPTAITGASLIEGLCPVQRLSKSRLQWKAALYDGNGKLTENGECRCNFSQTCVALETSLSFSGSCCPLSEVSKRIAMPEMSASGIRRSILSLRHVFIICMVLLCVQLQHFRMRTCQSPDLAAEKNRVAGMLSIPKPGLIVSLAKVPSVLCFLSSLFIFRL